MEVSLALALAWGHRRKCKLWNDIEADIQLEYLKQIQN